MQKEMRQDRRIGRTRTMLHEALLSLLSEKPLESITVRELCERADVNRKTFYNHYLDLDTLLDELEDELVDRFSEQLDVRQQLLYADNPTRFFEKLIDEIEKNEGLLRMQACYIDSRRYLFKMIARERRLLEAMMDPEQMDPQMMDYYLVFITEGIVAVLRRWLQDPHPVPAGELASMLGTMFNAPETRGFLNASGQKPGPEAEREKSSEK